MIAVQHPAGRTQFLANLQMVVLQFTQLFDQLGMVCLEVIHRRFLCRPRFWSEDEALGLVWLRNDVEVDMVHFLVR